jgi:hypothetical protein
MIQLMKVATMYNPTGWALIPTTRGKYNLFVSGEGVPTLVLHKVGKTWSATAMDTGYSLSTGSATKEQAISAAIARYFDAVKRGADFASKIPALKLEHDAAVNKYFPQ